jgi:MFS family permease
VREYFSRVRAIQPNARLFLAGMVLAGVFHGVFRLLFNFFVLSLGYDEALLGRLVTANSLTALLAALPSGFIADRLSRKASLLAAGVALTLSTLFMVLWPSVAMLYFANVLAGLGLSLAGVTMGPFLMENSGDEERTYLFSYNMGLQTVSASVGNWLGGYLPGWMGSALGYVPESSQAYSWALIVAAGISGVSLLPILVLRSPRIERSERSVFAPLAYASRYPGLLTRLILPMLVTSIGAGLIMPFMNVFYRVQYGQPDPVIGALFAWGSLAMGLGLLIAPPLAERMGKIQFVVVTQGLSIPLLAVMGFAPWFWLSAAAYYVRLALMNMSGPVYETFVMERVESSARATVASLTSMAWNFGWAFSPMVSGWLQVRYGFAPAFIGVILLYSLSVWMYWIFFWRGRPAIPVVAPGD